MVLENLPVISVPVSEDHKVAAASNIAYKVTQKVTSPNGYVTETEEEATVDHRIEIEPVKKGATAREIMDEVQKDVEELIRRSPARGMYSRGPLH